MVTVKELDEKIAHQERLLRTMFREVDDRIKVLENRTEAFMKELVKQ